VTKIYIFSLIVDKFITPFEQVKLILTACLYFSC